MSAGIDVVVPVARGGAAAADCRAALEREAGDGFRVLQDEFAWQARQRALDESDADVIAFVDPDVVVADGWLDALRGAWEQSPHSVAAVGGPIHGQAPPWDAGRRGLIDLGEEVLELDPAERTLFGGNLSFWRRALVGVGGFGAPLDGRDAVDWLSEEHEAQRQLGHWGWLLRYEPAMAAARMAPRVGSFSRAWRYGVRTGLARSREASVAFRQGVRSGVGAVGAGVRGRRDEAAERVARAAENFGVVAGARRAPVAPSVPTRSTFAARGAVNVDLVLLYHRFAAGEPDPLGLCVSPAHFEEHLRVLKEDFEVVPLADIASTARSGAAGAGRLAITIDDGYVDNLTAGVPLLADAGLPATLFASTGHVETGKRFFWDEMERLITGPGPRPRELAIDGQRWPTATLDEREVARAELHRHTQPLSAQEIDHVLEQLRDWAGDAALAPTESTRPVTPDELRQLAEHVEIGAHTRDHVNLGHAAPDELRVQVERSRDDVRSWTGRRPRAFSYPFGIPRHDVCDAARAAVAAAGFECAVVNQPVAVEAGADPYAIPRLVVSDVGGDAFRANIWRALR